MKNPPAFPAAPRGCAVSSTRLEALDAHSGMTLRDWFAGHSLQAILTGKSGIHPGDVHLVCADAYLIADGMLKAREVMP